MGQGLHPQTARASLTPPPPKPTDQRPTHGKAGQTSGSTMPSSNPPAIEDQQPKRKINTPTHPRIQAKFLKVAFTDLSIRAQSHLTGQISVTNVLCGQKFLKRIAGVARLRWGRVVVSGNRGQNTDYHSRPPTTLRAAKR